jgi:hypothetical protein
VEARADVAGARGRLCTGLGLTKPGRPRGIDERTNERQASASDPCMRRPRWRTTVPRRVLVVMAGETNRTNDKGQEEGDKRDGTGRDRSAVSEHVEGRRRSTTTRRRRQREREAPRRHARQGRGQWQKRPALHGGPEEEQAAPSPTVSTTDTRRTPSRAAAPPLVRRRARSIVPAR